jgi:hypothetical protein
MRTRASPLPGVGVGRLTGWRLRALAVEKTRFKVRTGRRSRRVWQEGRVGGRWLSWWLWSERARGEVELRLHFSECGEAGRGRLRSEIPEGSR